MITQLQGAVATPVNKQVITQAKFEQYEEKVASPSYQKFPFQLLSDATETILRYAFLLAHFKKTRSLREYKKLLHELGFSGEEKKYLKVAATFQKFSPEDLTQIEPRTIYQLAENSKKYQSVIDRLLDLTVVTQEAVRELIILERKPRVPKPDKPSIWRRMNNGRRYCQIPPIHEQDERTGVTLQKMMDEEGLSAQHIVAEAIALRQAHKEGRLVTQEKT
ncbi:MAG: hypothetical protein PUP92_03440 [Rhizonema sp. PD38]|nr:hypothetical protein [Rhizonema sp. PD38]